MIRTYILSTGLLGLAACSAESTDGGPIPYYIGGVSSDLCMVDYDAAPQGGVSKTLVDLTGFVPAKKTGNTGSLVTNRIGPNGELVLFYAINDWTLQTNDHDDLNWYIARNAGQEDWVLEGHADMVGPTGWNYSLGWNRAKGVKDGFLHGAEIFSVGESEAVQANASDLDLAEDRFLRVVPGTPITRALDTHPADVYLVDLSGSMAGSKWAEVAVYRYRADSLVFTFTGQKRECGGHLKDQTPEGSTPLFRSLSELIQGSERGSTITVLTDGGDNIGQTSHEAVVQHAKANGVTVNVVGLNVSARERTPLEEIARATQGHVSFGRVVSLD
jgi:hypothetical protein